MDGRLSLPSAVDVETSPQETSRIITIPNVVTLVRFAVLPVYLWLLFGRQNYVAAGWVLGALGATDWIDGKLARRLGQVSAVGKVLDPVVDRILMLTAVITAAWVHAVPLWFAGLTLLREVLVSGATLLVASLGGRRIDVLWVGKAGTFAMMTSYPAFLIAHGPAGWQKVFLVIAWIAGLAGLVLAWTALFSYVEPALAALREGRAGRRARKPSGLG